MITRNRVSRPEGFGIEVDGGDRNATMRNSVRDIGHDEISVGFDVVGNVVRRNHIRGAGEDGVQVVAKAKRTLVKRNHAFGAKDNGVDANHSTTKLTRSEGRRNGDLGIEDVRRRDRRGREHRPPHGAPASARTSCNWPASRVDGPRWGRRAGRMPPHLAAYRPRD